MIQAVDQEFMRTRSGVSILPTAPGLRSGSATHQIQNARQIPQPAPPTGIPTISSLGTRREARPTLAPAPARALSATTSMPLPAGARRIQAVGLSFRRHRLIPVIVRKA